MGGLYGHIPQVWEARDLTYSQLKDIVKLAVTGKLEDMHEKTDGQQLCFSYDLKKNKPVFARNNGDILSRGLDVQALLDRFSSENKPLVRETFAEAFDALTLALTTLRRESAYISEMISIFGIECNDWYSVEVINKKNPNVIEYGRNVLVLHAQPLFHRDDASKSVKRLQNVKLSLFNKHMQSMNNALARIGWSLYKPQLVTVDTMTAVDDYVHETLGRIDDFVKSRGAKLSDTLNDTCAAALLPLFDGIYVSDAAKHCAIKYVLKLKSYNQLRQHATKRELTVMKPCIEASRIFVEHLMRPLETTLHTFSREFLKHVSPVLVTNEQEQVLAIREKLVDAIETATGDTLVVIERQLETLGSICEVSTGFEGVTFSYGGRVFKFTGCFSQVNQILGAKRYGRRLRDEET